MCLRERGKGRGGGGTETRTRPEGRKVKELLQIVMLYVLKIVVFKVCE